MQKTFGGAGTVLLAAATATCGLLMLGGVSPAADGPDISLPPVDPTTTIAATSTTTAPTTTTTTTSTTTTSTAAPTTTTTTTTTSVAPRPDPIPLSVSASNNVVGAGGVVTFEGTCPVDADGTALGPVVARIIGIATDTVDTGVTSVTWAYAWTAPTAEALITSYTFEFWCGDPAGFTGGYPVELQRQVDIVASAAVPTTAPPDAPAGLLPETD